MKCNSCYMENNKESFQGCKKNRRSNRSQCYDCCMEESRTKECTVPGCTEKRHSDQLCKVHTQSKRREQYSISQEKFNTVKCPLCGGEFPLASRGKDMEPCQKKSNPACYLRCRAFIANGVQCGNDRRAKGKVEPKRYL
jgi:hypothetical protein